MAFPWIPLITGGASLIGGAMEMFGQNSANRENVSLARENREFESKEAIAQRDWEERMSSTAYQRQVQDMRASGINPMAAFGSGGASTPSGAKASGSVARVERLPSPLNSVVTSALDTIRTMAEADKAREATKLLKVERVKTGYEAEGASWLPEMMRARISSARTYADTLKELTPGRKGALVPFKNRGDFESKFPRFFGGYDSIMSRLLPVMHSARDFME